MASWVAFFFSLFLFLFIFILCDFTFSAQILSQCQGFKALMSVRLKLPFSSLPPFCRTSSFWRGSQRNKYCAISRPLAARIKMRACSSLLMASSSTIASISGLKPAPLALLPPIPLYRRLLRVHRKKLPKDMRLLGDEYVRSEFRAHRNVENPIHVVSHAIPCPQSLQHHADPEPPDWVFDRMAALCAET